MTGPETVYVVHGKTREVFMCDKRFRGIGWCVGRAHRGGSLQPVFP
jgi:hypothetical protein